VIRPLILGLLLVASPALARAQATPPAERRAVDRAERLLDTGRTAEAIGVLEEHLGAEPASPEALALLRRLLVQAGDPERFLSRIEAAAERAPRDPAIRHLRVRALLDAGRVDSALAVAESWAADSPAEPRAALALAEAAEAAGDAGRGMRALEAAELRVEDPAALRARRADLALSSGDHGQAIAAWVALLASATPGIDAVAEDLTGAGERSGVLLADLASALGPGPGAGAGALVALRLRAASTARQLAVAAGDDDRPAFLREYVREADRTGLAEEVAWAATELVRLSPRPIDRLRWRAMAADRALAAGDSVGAREAFSDLAAETDPGDAPHEAATRRLLELLAASPGELDEAERLFRRYAAEYPDSTRVRAELIGRLALGYATAGDPARAESRIAEGRRGLDAGSAAPLEAAAAWVAWYAGARDSALARLGRSLADPSLAPAERTARLRAATVLQGADSAEVALSGRVALGLRRDPRGFDPGPSLRELAGLPASPGRPGVLLQMADVAADAGRGDVAGPLRRRVVEAFPASAEAPAALLDLARAAPPDGRREWLERLIVGYPDSALAPVARRLLAELEGGARG